MFLSSRPRPSHSARRDESANYGAGMGSFIQLLAENSARSAYRSRRSPPRRLRRGRAPPPAVSRNMTANASTHSLQAPAAATRGGPNHPTA
jgi:hypothetical protein